MTLTEFLIHSIEAFIVGLVLVKLLQVRSLYLRSRPTKDTSTRVAGSTTTAKERTVCNSNKNSLCLKHLPLPEVSFSNDDLTETKQSKSPIKKCVLENYIDDFFNDPIISSTSFSKKPMVENEKDDDEFITIQEQNAKIVRKIQVAAKSTKFAS